jgi:hypothetical protein
MDRTEIIELVRLSVGLDGILKKLHQFKQLLELLAEEMPSELEPTVESLLAYDAKFCRYWYDQFSLLEEIRTHPKVSRLADALIGESQNVSREIIDQWSMLVSSTRNPSTEQAAVSHHPLLRECGSACAHWHQRLDELVTRYIDLQSEIDRQFEPS